MHVSGTVNCFTVDKEKNIIGLNLHSLEIADVSFLKDLINLSCNQIIDISYLEYSDELILLDLRFNRISQIPPQIIDLDLELKWQDEWRRGILLEGNRLDPPPFEIVEKGKNAIKTYFKFSMMFLKAGNIFFEKRSNCISIYL